MHPSKKFTSLYHLIIMMTAEAVLVGAFAFWGGGSERTLGWMAQQQFTLDSLIPSDGFARQPTWEQDFTTVAHGSIDTDVWRYDLNPDVPGWNNERQGYTNRLANVRVENGRLVIEARKEPYTYPNDSQKRKFAYTSGRIDTLGTKEGLKFEYGKIEIEMKMPQGKGTWPAAWLLSANQPFTNKIIQQKTANMHGDTKATTIEELWQRQGFHTHDGEPDIVEHYGHMPGIIEATANVFSGRSEGRAEVPDATETFHVYGMEITPESIVWTVDGRPYHQYQKPSDDPDDWPFGQGNEFYLILNLAMGGTAAGTIDDVDGPWRLEVKRASFYEYTVP